MTPPATLRRTLGFTRSHADHDRNRDRLRHLPRAERRAAPERGNARVAILIWTAGGVLSLLGALTYAELGAANPDAGGLYVYLRDAFGPLTAFLYGWTSFVVIASGSVATLAVAFTNYLSQLVPLGGPRRVDFRRLIAVLGVVNIRGTRNSATMQNWTTGAKVAVLTLLSIALIVSGAGTRHARDRAGAGGPLTFAGIGAAMIAVLWAYEGWQYVTFSAGETTRSAARVSARDHGRDRGARRDLSPGELRLPRCARPARPPRRAITWRRTPSARFSAQRRERSSVR